MSEVGFEPTPSVEDQNTFLELSVNQGFYLESGALDRSAILTCRCTLTINNIFLRFVW